ncbi:MAG: ABC transporter ATP-binding protein, partial [Actinomycetota bacterium]|nr:ABC transporter ATP-binding protein [Actinomycetota bacterium]
FMRLGFAVSVHADCEVFLVDEGLAVGDAPFKRKCVRKIKELHDEGRTLFLVSHNIKQVAKMCDRALVLDQGRLALDGSPDDASKYLAGEYDEDIEGDDF